jgi:molybdopterin-synthase adenylyltransferase
MNVEKYSRQILFAPIGPEGQRKLTESRVTIIGCGALGAVQAEALARAGVGFMRLADRDFVEESNLQRQIMFEEQDAEERLPKAIACERRVRRINGDVRVEPIVANVSHANIEELITDVDVVLDGTDNFETRYLINDACVKSAKPWIYGAVVGSYGLTMTIIPHRTPCLRCVIEKLPPPGSSPTCDTVGVILPIILTIASIQATEAIKLLTGQPDQLHRSIIQIDLWRHTFHRIKLGRLLEASDCPACKHGRFEFLDARIRQLASGLCGRNAVYISQSNRVRIDLAALAERLRPIGSVKLTEHLLIVQIGVHEINVFVDGHCIVKGTTDVDQARNLYARYIGS